MISVDNVNRAFPRYPMTVEDKGWVYGVWYCGTAWTRPRLYGEYPPTFLRRALALFPDAKNILHCPSGTVTGPGITVDAQPNHVVKPMVIADAARLPFKDGSFDLILSDPPYSPGDALKYGVAKWSSVAALKEFHRILSPGGHLGFLHTYYPSYYRKNWRLLGLIAVVTGFLRQTRMFSIFERIE